MYSTKNKPIPAFIGFVIGVALMLLVKYLTDREQGESGQSNGSESSASLLLPLGIDVAIDGLLIGLSFAAGVMAGLLLTVALAVELMFLGLAAVVSLNEYGSSL